MWTRSVCGKAVRNDAYSSFLLLDVRELNDCLARGIAGRVQWVVARGQRVGSDRAAIGRIAPDIRGSSSSYRAT